MEAGRNPSESPPHGSLKRRRIATGTGASSDEETPNLPEEIIVDILTRLPAKSLLKFRCVSKSWRSLISSPSFARSHLEAAEKDSTLTNYRVMLTVTEPGFDLKHASVRSVMDEPSIDAVNIHYPQKHPHSSVWVVGTHNGLICIAINERDLFLWNPATRVHNKLPTVEVDLMPGFYNMFGFGYNEATDEYKVLGFFCLFGNGGNYESVVKMYSQKANSWKVMEGYNSVVPLHDSGKLVNGKLHFLTSPGLGLESRWEIVSVDLDSEKYGMIEQPDYGDWSFESLGVLGGCICVLCNSYNQQDSNRADLWVLKEYGVKESWTKLVRFQHIDEPGKYLYLNPLMMLPSGEILLVCGERLAIYNPRDNVWTYPEIRAVRSFLDADVYVESLVSPHLNTNDGCFSG